MMPPIYLQGAESTAIRTSLNFWIFVELSTNDQKRFILGGTVRSFGQAEDQTLAIAAMCRILGRQGVLGNAKDARLGGFEPATSWSRRLVARRVNNLHGV
jgi:hypothetical protein